MSGLDVETEVEVDVEEDEVGLVEEELDALVDTVMLDDGVTERDMELD